VGAALFRRRRLAGGALLGRRRLGFQAADQDQRRAADLCGPPLQPAGRRSHWGLDPSRSSKGILLDRRQPHPPPTSNPYCSTMNMSPGILTTQGWFAQKYGYFEIRAKVPIGPACGRHSGCWPMTAGLAARDRRPRRPRPAARRSRDDDTLADSDRTHRVLRIRFPVAGRCEPFPTITACCGSGIASSISSTASRFPIIKVPIGFDDPMYMIVNLAMGSKYFGGASASSMANRRSWSNLRSTGFRPIKSILIRHPGRSSARCRTRPTPRRASMLGKFSRRQLWQVSGRVSGSA